MKKEKLYMLTVCWDGEWKIAGFFETPEEAAQSKYKNWQGYKLGDWKILIVKEVFCTG